MAEKYSLSAQTRVLDKATRKALTTSGRIPAVVYGYKVETLPISLDCSEILRTYRKTGTAGLIDLDVDGKNIQVIIKDLSINPVRQEITHVDFYAVNAKEKTSVKVPFTFEGESNAVKTFGGVFTVAHESVEIRCLPNDIPHDFLVNISSIENLGDSVTLDQLNLPEKYEVMHAAPDMMICSVTGRKASDSDDEEAATEDAGEESAEEETSSEEA